MDYINEKVEDIYRKQGNNKYYQIKNELEKNKSYIRYIAKKIYSQKTQDLNPLNDIREEILYLIETLDYLSYSCEMKSEFRNAFFPFTTFYRVSVLCLKNILTKIYIIIKENNLKDNDTIKDLWENIQEFSENIIKYRNDLEHNIDPFFMDFIIFLDDINVSNIIQYLKKVEELIDIISKEEIKVKRKSKYNFYYTELDQKQIILKIESLNYIKNNLFAKVNEISYYLRDKSIKRMIMKNKNNRISNKLINEDSERNLIDLVIKQLELNKALLFTYKTERLKIKNYSEINIDSYKYFHKLSISFYYQMFDKLSLYIKDKHKLNIDKPYFKDAILEIMGKPISFDLIDRKLIELYKSDEYQMLKKIRQVIVHGEKYMDFVDDYKKISSLIVNINEKTNYLILEIVNEYMNKKNLLISEDAIIESINMTTCKKL